MAKLLEFLDADTAAAALAQHVAAGLKADLAQQEQAVLVVSGGRSPVPFFHALAAQPLDWARVLVTLADERWVPPDHPDSNEALVRRHLLTGRAAAARMVPLWSASATPEAAAQALVPVLAALPRPFGQVVLGMGEDGHVASLFPDAPELQEGLRTAEPVLAVHPGAAPHPRLSLSLATLLQSRDLALLVSGEPKARLLERALGDGPVEELPVRAVLRQEAVPVSVFWAP